MSLRALPVDSTAPGCASGVSAVALCPVPSACARSAQNERERVGTSTRTKRLPPSGLKGGKGPGTGEETQARRHRSAEGRDGEHSKTVSTETRNRTCVRCVLAQVPRVPDPRAERSTWPKNPSHVVAPRPRLRGGRTVGSRTSPWSTWWTATCSSSSTRRIAACRAVDRVHATRHLYPILARCLQPQSL